RIADPVTAFPLAHRRLDGLPRERPQAPRVAVAAIEVLAPLVAHEVLLPAREAIERGVLEPRVARTRLRDDRAVLAGADDVHPWPRCVRPGDDELVPVAREVSVLRVETAFGQGSLRAGSAGARHTDTLASRPAPCGADRDAGAGPLGAESTAR